MADKTLPKEGDYQPSLIDLIEEFNDYVEAEAMGQAEQGVVKASESVVLDIRAIQDFLEDLRTVGDFVTALIVKGPQ